MEICNQTGKKKFSEIHVNMKIDYLSQFKQLNYTKNILESFHILNILNDLTTCMIKPFLLYGAGIWVTELADQIEEVRNKF